VSSIDKPGQLAAAERADRPEGEIAESQRPHSGPLQFDHAAVQVANEAFRGLFSQAPQISRWNFSTNGVVINGLHGVPCVGFGPGREELAHARDEHVPVADVIRACAFYAAFPAAFCQRATRG